MASSVCELLTANPVSSSSWSSSTIVPRSQFLGTFSWRPSRSSASFSSGRVSSSPGAAGSARCRTMTQERPVASPSLYSLLGLEQDVALTDIKTAYRQMARRYHPDVCPPSEREECTKMFLKVQDAYEVLSDPERRANYDYHLINPLSANALGWEKSMVKRQTWTSDFAAWKMRWQDQLTRFEKRNPQSDSWGARMRAKREAEN